jgi:hypothetical protein
MKTSDAFPSKYMKAEDFAEGEVRVLTIRNVEPEELGQGQKKETKPVMTFREPNTKPFVMNKTNWGIVADTYKYGDDSDLWLGRKIALHVLEVEMKGDIVRAIRVKTKLPTAAPAPRPTPEPDLFGPEDEMAIPDVPAGIPPMKR